MSRYPIWLSVLVPASGPQFFNCRPRATIKKFLQRSNITPYFIMLLPLILFASTSTSNFDPLNVLGWLYINDEAEKADCDLPCPVGL